MEIKVDYPSLEAGCQQVAAAADNLSAQQGAFSVSPSPASPAVAAFFGQIDRVRSIKQKYETLLRADAARVRTEVETLRQADTQRAADHAQTGSGSLIAADVHVASSPDGQLAAQVEDVAGSFLQGVHAADTTPIIDIPDVMAFLETFDFTTLTTPRENGSSLLDAIATGLREDGVAIPDDWSGDDPTLDVPGQAAGDGDTVQIRDDQQGGSTPSMNVLTQPVPITGGDVLHVEPLETPEVPADVSRQADPVPALGNEPLRAETIGPLQAEVVGSAANMEPLIKVDTTAGATRATAGPILDTPEEDA